MNSQVSIEVVEPRSFASAVADEIVLSLREGLDEREHVSLVFAGGSTPSATYRLLGRPPRVSEIDWGRVHFFWGDERWVSQDDNASNCRLARETFLSQASSVKEETIHPIDTSLGTPDEAAAAYEATVVSVLGGSQEQPPKFDLVLLGMGEDGHIASLFPGSEMVGLEGGICRATKHTDGSPRITLTPDALFSARRILFLVSGGGKAAVLKKVLEGQGSESELPACLYRKGAERVTWFVDSPAAKNLSIDTSGG